ncbi:unnamed protein product [Bemisia tabaci]|uniref:39S ribosomal protein L55, mitochondrial n=1 Tax=Bemisia tabaci TaxID=7038 RepID=A0A9P0CE27_BEMTA|nr:PREDICTED: 39S ribosomal protein L55, mitochondrial [Bemisia tabaci]CAH0772770.1 unnamed protein product [Bemisia tabaci]
MNQALIITRNLSSATAAVTKIHRSTYARVYKAVIVKPDGSTIRTRCYPEPRLIIKLPLDLNELSDKDKQIRLALRKPRQQVKVQEDIEHDFDAKKYLQFVKKVKK